MRGHVASCVTVDMGICREESGATREALRALHDRIIELGVSLGDDVRICPCKTIVPLYRKHVFAEIKPALALFSALFVLVRWRFPRFGSSHLSFHVLTFPTSGHVPLSHRE